MIGVAVAGAPLFHTLFGHKWDSAIPLFQILTIRGIFFVLTSLYNNYILALGYARRLFIIELVKDGLVVAAVLCTVWYHSVPLLVWGQLGASALTWVAAMAIVSRATGYRTTLMLRDLAPYAAAALLAGGAAFATLFLPLHPALLLLCVTTAGGGLYAGISFIFHFPELTELKKRISRSA